MSGVERIVQLASPSVCVALLLGPRQNIRHRLRRVELHPVHLPVVPILPGFVAVLPVLPTLTVGLLPPIPEVLDGLERQGAGVELGGGVQSRVWVVLVVARRVEHAALPLADAFVKFELVSGGNVVVLVSF